MAVRGGMEGAQSLLWLGCLPLRKNLSVRRLAVDDVATGDVFAAKAVEVMSGISMTEGALRQRCSASSTRRRAAWPKSVARVEASRPSARASASRRGGDELAGRTNRAVRFGSNSRTTPGTAGADPADHGVLPPARWASNERPRWPVDTRTGTEPHCAMSCTARSDALTAPAVRGSGCFIDPDLFEHGTDRHGAAARDRAAGMIP